MYIKTCNLVVSMTSCIHSPSLHNKVDSESCRGNRMRNPFALHVTHTSGQGGTAAFRSCKQGRFSIRRRMRILHVSSGSSGFSA
jgi:hypothetical protein